MASRIRQYVALIGLVAVLFFVFSSFRPAAKKPLPKAVPESQGLVVDPYDIDNVVKCPPVPECKTEVPVPAVAGNTLPHRRKNILVNFGHNCCTTSKKRNCDTGINVGGFDECRSFSMDDVDRDFYERNKGILTQKRGGGYWLWKPYVLFKTLRESQEGDIIFYSDAGAYFVKNMAPILELANEHEIVSFELPKDLLESTWTKRDTFKVLNVDERPVIPPKSFAQSPQRLAAFVVLKNTMKAQTFVANWLTYASDPRAVTDQANQLGDNYPGWRDHRHDQSVFSLLAKKWNVYKGTDPSQFGNADDYFIEHDRNKS